MLLMEQGVQVACNLTNLKGTIMSAQKEFMTLEAHRTTHHGLSKPKI